MKDKVLVVHLATRRQCIVNAATTFQFASLGEVLVDVGPHLEKMRIRAYAQDCAPGFQIKVTAEWSYDGTLWTPFAGEVLAATATTTTSNIAGTPYTTTADFGPLIRFTLGTYATGLGTGGTVSILVELTFAT